jgi:hypothetical protein
MDTKRIALAAMLALAVATPAMAKYRHPGVADPPGMEGVQENTNFDPDALNAQPAAEPAAEPAASAAASTPATDSDSWRNLGYVVEGDKADKRINGNP